VVGGARLLRAGRDGSSCAHTRGAGRGSGDTVLCRRLHHRHVALESGDRPQRDCPIRSGTGQNSCRFSCPAHFYPTDYGHPISGCREQWMWGAVPLARARHGRRGERGRVVLAGDLPRPRPPTDEPCSFSLPSLPLDHSPAANCNPLRFILANAERRTFQAERMHYGGRDEWAVIGPTGPVDRPSCRQSAVVGHPYPRLPRR